MELLENNPEREIYFQLIKGRPQKSLKVFFKIVGIEEVPGTDEIFWQLPKLNWETKCRYFEYLTGHKAGDPNKMLSIIEKIIEENFPSRPPFPPPSSRLPYWKRDVLLILKKWIEDFVSSIVWG
ncbi:MAG: hypothetical protein DRO00_08135 [Thermoproteota archaeon]|nr:MAG: hypothetical protein DRO00_08135 [Candidatus Korarchaeota archaeon]